MKITLTSRKIEYFTQKTRAYNYNILAGSVAQQKNKKHKTVAE